MRVVLDINALLISIPRKSKFRPIFDAILQEKFELIISNDILSEYTEILQQKTNSVIANNIVETLINQSCVKKVEIYYEWKLIEQDPDDNKYVDCAISGGADLLVSNDQHFKILSDVNFPKITVMSVLKFLELIHTVEGSGPTPGI